MAAPRILIGEIGPAHGIRGEVHLRSFAGNPEDIAAYGPLTDEAGREVVRIAKVRAGAKGLIARLEGVVDRNAAEALRGTRLYVERARLPAAGPEQYYLVDLVGLAAVARDGTALGRILDVPNYGAGDLLEIAPAGGGETLLVPFTRDQVPEVDLAAGRIVVQLPDWAEDGPEEAGEPPEEEPEDGGRP